MFGIGPQELLLILVIALVVVGPARLPEISRSIGKGLREIRKAQDEVRKTIQVNLDDEPRPAPARGGSASSTAAPASEGSATDPEGAPPTTSLAAAAGAATRPVNEISKTLGRGLAELRKARREIERSFRVEDDRPASPAAGRTGPGAPAKRPGAAEPSGVTTSAEPSGEAPPTGDDPDAPDEHGSAG